MLCGFKRAASSHKHTGIPTSHCSQCAKCASLPRQHSVCYCLTRSRGASSPWRACACDWGMIHYGCVACPCPYTQGLACTCCGRLFELLKNAMRAAVEARRGRAGTAPPPVVVRICDAPSSVTLRISDQARSNPLRTFQGDRQVLVRPNCDPHCLQPCCPHLWHNPPASCMMKNGHHNALLACAHSFGMLCASRLLVLAGKHHTALHLPGCCGTHMRVM